MSTHYPPVDDPCHMECKDVSHSTWNLAGAVAAVEQVGITALNTENRALRDALTHLQAQFEVSQKVADLAITDLNDAMKYYNRACDAIERQQADLETLRAAAQRVVDAQEARGQSIGSVDEFYAALDALTLVVTPTPEGDDGR